MQVVARELADDITPQVDLLEMAAPVVQVPQRPPIRHLRFCAVALNIVPVLQHALRRLLAQQVTRTVVAEPDNFRLSAFRRIMLPAADFQQTVRRVVPVFRARLRRDFRRQPPRRITLQTVTDFSPRSPPYITAVTAFSALYPYARRLPPGSVCSVTRSRTSYRNR